MIRAAERKDIPRIHEIINRAAERYRNHVPDECLSDPYMPLDELQSEYEAMRFSVYQPEPDAPIVGVMALQTVDDAELIRHAYVWPDLQRSGIGTSLLEHNIQRAERNVILVGTWADASWAIRFYEKHGFQLHSPEQTETLLLRYWNVPKLQRDHSVVLELKRL